MLAIGSVQVANSIKINRKLFWMMSYHSLDVKGPVSRENMFNRFREEMEKTLVDDYADTVGFFPFWKIEN